MGCHAKNWKKSFRVVDASGEPGPRFIEWEASNAGPSHEGSAIDGAQPAHEECDKRMSTFTPADVDAAANEKSDTEIEPVKCAQDVKEQVYF